MKVKHLRQPEELEVRSAIVAVSIVDSSDKLDKVFAPSAAHWAEEYQHPDRVEEEEVDPAVTRQPNPEDNHERRTRISSWTCSHQASHSTT